jgi:TRAP-type transport system periplasmic protein
MVMTKRRQRKGREAKMKSTIAKASCMAAFIAVSLVSIPSPVIGQSPKQMVWKLDTFEPLEHPHTLMFKKFAEKVKARTNDRLEIKVLAGGASGYKGPETLRVLKQGFIEMGDITYGAVFDYPVAFINALPFLGTTYEEARKIERACKDILADDLKNKFNAKRMFSFPFPAQQLFSNFPAPKLSDWKGKKIRTYSQETASMVGKAGATPVTIVLPEIYTALSRGVIDGFFTGSMSIKPFKFQEVVKFANLVGFSVQASNVVVNAEALAKLPEEVKTILEEEAAKIEEELWELIEKKDGEWIAELPGLGMDVIKMEPGERTKLEEICRPLWEEWASKNAPFGPVLLEMARKVTGK